MTGPRHIPAAKKLGITNIFTGEVVTNKTSFKFKLGRSRLGKMPRLFQLFVTSLRNAIWEKPTRPAQPLLLT